MLEFVDAERRGLVGNAVFFSLRNVGYLVGAVFFTGCAGVVTGGRAAAPVGPTQPG